MMGAHDVGSAAVEMITTYLEMREHPRLQVRWPQRGGMLLRLEEPSVAFYRYLHERMGGEPDRLQGLSDADLADRLTDSAQDMFVFYLGGAPAGFFELDRRQEGEVRLVRLGLFPEFRGRRLGKWLLSFAVEAAWDYEPERVWTSVTDRDDPRTLLLCQWAGFVPYETSRREPGGPD
jgi:GNAT superfamily N-acetyltransferase